MGFQEELIANDKRGLFRSSANSITFKTGFRALDYGNGTYQTVKVGNEYRYVRRLGIPPGFTTIIGSTGVGKSTFCIGVGWNIIKNYKFSQLHYIDCEKTMQIQRIMSITGCKPEDIESGRIILNQQNTSIEDVLDSLTKICDMKETYKREIMFEVKDQSIDGKPYMAYPPTVYVIDSLPMFNSKEFDDKSLGGNIDGMRGARDISRFFTNCLDMAQKYNIIFLVINHIRPKADMNPYAQPPKGLMMLGQAEQLPRGAVAQYYSNTYFRINGKKSDAYTIKDNGFTGFKCNIQLAKSKSNVVGTSFPVAFAGQGFDPVYSLYEFAADRGLIQGRNPYLYFTGLEELKFSRNDFCNRMLYEAGFAAKVNAVLQPYFDALLGPLPQLNLEEENRMAKSYEVCDIDDTAPINSTIILTSDDSKSE